MATRLRLIANPVASMVVIAASQRVPQRVAALLAVMPQEHERAAGAWQAELAEWPQRVMSAHGAARATRAAGESAAHAQQHRRGGDESAQGGGGRVVQCTFGAARGAHHGAAVGGVEKPNSVSVKIYY